MTTLQLLDMGLTETHPEVFYVASGRARIDRTVLTFLKDRSMASPKRQCRICLHDSPAALVHEMVIAHLHGFYVRPHRHFSKAEGFTVVEGTADLLTFDDDGELNSVTPLTAPGEGGTYYSRMPIGVWHGLVIRSPCLIFHEVAQGPFDPASSQYAPWAPDGGDSVKVREFMDELDAKIAARRN